MIKNYHDSQSLVWNQLKPLADQIAEVEGVHVFYEGPLTDTVHGRYTQVRVDRANGFSLIRTTPHLEEVFKTNDKRIVQEKEEEMAAHFFMISQYKERCFQGRNKLSYTLKKLQGNSKPDFETVISGDEVQIEVTNIDDVRVNGKHQYYRKKYSNILSQRFPDRTVIALIEDEIKEKDLIFILRNAELLKLDSALALTAVKEVVHSGSRNILADISECDDVTDVFHDIEFIGEQFPSYFFQIIEAIKRKSEKKYSGNGVDLVLIDKTSSTPRYRRDAKVGLFRTYCLKSKFRRIVIISPFSYRVRKGFPLGEFWHMKIKDSEDYDVSSNVIMSFTIFQNIRQDLWQFTNPTEVKEILHGFYA